MKVFIIDPENEYTSIVEHLGGTVVHLSSNSTTKINPLEVYSEHVADETTANMEMILKDKIQRLLGFFQVLKQDITQVEKAVLDATLRQVYKDAGVHGFTSFREVPSTSYPILSDVYEALAKLKETDADRYGRIEDFHYILESYVNGSKTIFNGHTNINLQSDLLSFDLKPLQNEAEVQGAAYLNTFSYLWDNITENKEENVKLFVDEFHFLTQNPDAASFFYQAYKRFRKYNAGAIAGTQQIQDVLDGQMANGQNVGEAIIGNSYTKVFFGLDNKGVDDITRKLRMTFSDKERKLLERRKQGEALMIHGTQRAFMRIELTEEELRLKDPVRYEEVYGVSAEHVPNYEDRIHMTELEKQEALNMGEIQK
ncbi:type IV secretory pathway VirB4 component [Filibacter limicola]|uniref:Type IV secretory pathway VirB4 component n=1 Tax=Sporosarcina limicola TaxID=34101 RepID=A0A927RH44_9BACL|nr:type IV secretory pathway VirB4 component [Sporosarcina limicola]